MLFHYQPFQPGSCFRFQPDCDPVSPRIKSQCNSDSSKMVSLMSRYFIHLVSAFHFNTSLIFRAIRTDRLEIQVVVLWIAPLKRCARVVGKRYKVSEISVYPLRKLKSVCVSLVPLVSDGCETAPAAAPSWRGARPLPPADS